MKNPKSLPVRQAGKYYQIKNKHKIPNPKQQFGIWKLGFLPTGR
jgi:hypothetical protein